jgi:hypothetical protein
VPGVGTNRYSYSFNDPVNLADKNGHAADSILEPAIWAGIVVAIGITVVDMAINGRPTKKSDNLPPNMQELPVERGTTPPPGGPKPDPVVPTVGALLGAQQQAPAKTQDHHVVPQSFGHMAKDPHPAVTLSGYDVYGRGNVISISEDKHKGFTKAHREYNQSWKDFLDRLGDELKGGITTPSKAKDAISRERDRVADAIKDGSIDPRSGPGSISPSNTSRDGTNDGPDPAR